MRIKELLEAPLPPDVDPQKMNKHSMSYYDRLDYIAKKTLSKAGTGSSRVAFVFKYNGRDTVLKVASSDAGIAQNAAEIKLLSDPAIAALNITIPIIDFHPEDKYGRMIPTWLHMEYAAPATQKELCAVMKCGDLDILVNIAQNLMGRKASLTMQQIYDMLLNNYKVGIDGIDVAEEYANKLVQIYNHSKLVLRDLTMPDNWGMYKGTPRIIDLGFTEEVQSQHYRSTMS